MTTNCISITARAHPPDTLLHNYGCDYVRRVYKRAIMFQRNSTIEIAVFRHFVKKLHASHRLANVSLFWQSTERSRKAPFRRQFAFVTFWIRNHTRMFLLWLVSSLNMLSSQRIVPFISRFTYTALM